MYRNNLLGIIKVFFILVLCIENVSGQNLTNSPYSRFGLGDLNRQCFPQNLAMGGVGYGLHLNTNFNISNPASYSSFDLTVFETGLNSLTLQLENNSQKSASNNTSLGYMAFGIPLPKGWGLAFGILPYSSVGYAVTNIVNYADLENVKFRYNGSGGINKAFGGIAYSFKGFSVGANTSYLFGALKKEKRVIIDSKEISNTYYTWVLDDTRINGLSIDFGAQYKYQLSEKWGLTLGGVYGIDNKLNAKRNIAAYTYNPVNEIPVDSIFDIIEEDIALLPMFYGGGFSLEKGASWIFAFDFTSYKWSEFKIFNQNDSMQNSMNYSFGTQFTPDKTSLKYFKNVQYRAGARYQQTHLNINNTSINEVGISFGAGLPMRKSRSALNIAVEVGKRGTAENNLIKENFINARFGLTINDKWFIKRKYD